MEDTLRTPWRALVLIAGLGIALAPALSVPTVVRADDQLGEEAIVGEWWSEERDGRIQFFKAKTGTYTGRLVWSKKPRPDTENPNAKLRSRPVVGIILIWKLRFEDGEYVDGYVYNPEDGGTYRIEAEVLGPNAVKIRGYMGLSLFGQSQVWKRYR